MTNPRKPLRLNVGFLINSSIGVSREFFFDSLSIKSDDELEIVNIEGVAKISRTPQGLFVEAKFSGVISLECVRCLCNYPQTLHWKFSELFAFTQDNITESELLVPDDAHIDLQPLVYDYAFVELPIQPLCKPGCRGLCVECAQNLNVKDCGHRPAPDSPFSALKDIFSQDD